MIFLACTLEVKPLFLWFLGKTTVLFIFKVKPSFFWFHLESRCNPGSPRFFVGKTIAVSDFLVKTIVFLIFSR